MVKIKTGKESIVTTHASAKSKRIENMEEVANNDGSFIYLQKPPEIEKNNQAVVPNCLSYQWHVMLNLFCF